MTLQGSESCKVVKHAGTRCTLPSLFHWLLSEPCTIEAIFIILRGSRDRAHPFLGLPCLRYPKQKKLVLLYSPKPSKHAAVLKERRLNINETVVINLISGYIGLPRATLNISIKRPPSACPVSASILIDCISSLSLFVFAHLPSSIFSQDVWNFALRCPERRYSFH